MKRKVDFSNVKESSGINPKRVEEGDYLAKVIKVESAPTIFLLLLVPFGVSVLYELYFDDSK